MDPKRILLVVDDTPNIGRALSRALGRHFDQVHTAVSAAEANALLEREPVTHVICDHNLAEGDPTGLALLPRWRKTYPSIERGIILTGLNEKTLQKCPGIDAIASKLVGSAELLALLGRD